MSMLNEARTASEIHAAIHAAVEAEDPDTTPPTPSELAAWFPECSKAARDEADARLLAVGEAAGKAGFLPQSARWIITFHHTPQAGFQLQAVFQWCGLAFPALRFDSTAIASFLDVHQVHELWRTLPDCEAPKHPLAPLVRAWIDRPEVSRPEDREGGIFPKSIVMIRSDTKTHRTQHGMLFSSAAHLCHGADAHRPICPASARAMRTAPT